MADKQGEADKAAALREYRDKHDAAVGRIKALRAARLARDAAAAGKARPPNAAPEKPPRKSKKK